MAVNFRSKKDTGPRTNEKITASEVRVISSTGKQLGIISIREALNQAEDEGFDLVEVSPEALSLIHICRCRRRLRCRSRWSPYH